MKPTTEQQQPRKRQLSPQLCYPLTADCIPHPEAVPRYSANARFRVVHLPLYKLPLNLPFMQGKKPSKRDVRAPKTVCLIQSVSSIIDSPLDLPSPPSMQVNLAIKEGKQHLTFDINESDYANTSGSSSSTDNTNHYHPTSKSSFLSSSSASNCRVRLTYGHEDTSKHTIEDISPVKFSSSTSSSGTELLTLFPELDEPRTPATPPTTLTSSPMEKQMGIEIEIEEDVENIICSSNYRVSTTHTPLPDHLCTTDHLPLSLYPYINDAMAAEIIPSLPRHAPDRNVGNNCRVYKLCDACHHRRPSVHKGRTCHTPGKFCATSLYRKLEDMNICEDCMERCKGCGVEACIKCWMVSQTLNQISTCSFCPSRLASAKAKAKAETEEEEEEEDEEEEEEVDEMKGKSDEERHKYALPIGSTHLRHAPPPHTRSATYCKRCIFTGNNRCERCRDIVCGKCCVGGTIMCPKCAATPRASSPPLSISLRPRRLNAEEELQRELGLY